MSLCLARLCAVLWCCFLLPGIAVAAESACDWSAAQQRPHWVFWNTCTVPLSADEVPSRFRAGVYDDKPDGQWLKLTLNNRLATPQALVVSLGIPDAYVAVIWDTEAHQPLLSLNESSRFYDRTSLSPVLSVDVVASAASTNIWYVYYRTHGKTPLLVQVIGKSYSDLVQGRSHLFNGVVYGVMLLLVVLLTLYQRGRGYRFYALLVLISLCFMVQVDGYSFAYLWPESPHWNMRAPILLGACILVSHVLFAMRFLQLSWRFPRLYRWHQAVLCLAPLPIVWEFFAPAEALLGVIVTGYSMIAVVASWYAMRHQVPAARFYFLGTCSLMLFSVVLFSSAILWRNLFPEINALTYPKLGYWFEAIFFAAAVIHQRRDFNRQQAESRAKRLAEVEQLFRAEQARVQALALAEQKQLQLASASHDISQPLASIRFALSALHVSDDQSHLGQHIEKTLNYAQTLLKDILDQSRQEWTHVQEPIALPNLFAQLEQEFLPQAQAKSISLEIIYSRLSCNGSTLLLYRILNNLLANAIRYTPKGRVCLGVRRRSGAIEIQVVDTGPGIPQPLIQSLLQPFRQGESTHQGYGLGLFIVKSLCQACGYVFSVTSIPGRGTLFAIRIPLSEG